MLRREFLVAGAASLCPLSALGQQNAKMPRVGFLTSASQPGSIETSYLTGFPYGMRELGYVEGKDYILEWRFAEGRVERFRGFAAQLVHLKVDVIVLGTPTALPAVLHETSSIPVVLGCVLQLCEGAFQAANEPGDGRWRVGSALEYRRYGRAG
jgi:putative tryptophan/tyrosine transport system substrate-binding protein